MLVGVRFGPDSPVLRVPAYRCHTLSLRLPTNPFSPPVWIVGPPNCIKFPRLKRHYHFPLACGKALPVYGYSAHLGAFGEAPNHGIYKSAACMNTETLS